LTKFFEWSEKIKNNFYNNDLIISNTQNIEKSKENSLNILKDLLFIAGLKQEISDKLTNTILIKLNTEFSWKKEEFVSILNEIASTRSFLNNLDNSLIHCLELSIETCLMKFSEASSNICHFIDEKIKINDSLTENNINFHENLAYLLKFIREKDIFAQKYLILLVKRIISHKINIEQEEIFCRTLNLSNLPLIELDRIKKIVTDTKKSLEIEEIDENLAKKMQIIVLPYSAFKQGVPSLDMETTVSFFASRLGLNCMDEIAKLKMIFLDRYKKIHEGRKLMFLHQYDTIIMSWGNLTLETNLFQAKILLILEKNGPLTTEEIKKEFYDHESNEKEYNDLFITALLSLKPFISEKPNNNLNNNNNNLNNNNYIYSLIEDEKEIITGPWPIKSKSPSKESPTKTTTTKRKRLSLLNNYNLKSKELLLFGYKKNEKDDEYLMIQKQRDYTLQALIVKILKQKKIISKDDLIRDVIDGIAQSFIPSKEKIERNIITLIEKEYLKENSNGKYEYIA